MPRPDQRWRDGTFEYVQLDKPTTPLQDPERLDQCTMTSPTSSDLGSSSPTSKTPLQLSTSMESTVGSRGTTSPLLPHSSEGSPNKPESDVEGGDAPRIKALNEFATKHPGCCLRCGWHMSSHGRDRYEDCPWGWSPAAKEGDLPPRQGRFPTRQSSEYDHGWIDGYNKAVLNAFELDGLAATADATTSASAHMSAELRGAAEMARKQGQGVVADLFDYEAERFFNAYEAEPDLRYVVIPPRERQLVLALARTYTCATPPGSSRP